MIKKIGLYAFILFVVLTLPNTKVASAMEKNSTSVACHERACSKNETKKSTITQFAAAQRQFIPKDEPSLNPDIIFNLINTYRAKLGLPAFEKDPKLCELAKSREPELYGEIFGGRGIHSGFRALHLPYWATENMKYGPDENEVFNWWLSSPIHHRAIVNNDKYSCGACKGHVCIELFTSYIPK